MSRLRVAVVGCGHLGTIHARLLAAREDVELVAVVDPVAAARDRVAAMHGCRGLASPSDLRGMVDAAVVASPTDLHADSAVPLLEAGIDLLVEKPIASSRREAGRIADVADRNGRVVAVVSMECYQLKLRVDLRVGDMPHILVDPNREAVCAVEYELIVAVSAVDGQRGSVETEHLGEAEIDVAVAAGELGIMRFTRCFAYSVPIAGDWLPR